MSTTKRKSNKSGVLPLKTKLTIKLKEIDDERQTINVFLDDYVADCHQLAASHLQERSATKFTEGFSEINSILERKSTKLLLWRLELADKLSDGNFDSQDSDGQSEQSLATSEYSSNATTAFSVFNNSSSLIPVNDTTNPQTQETLPINQEPVKATKLVPADASIPLTGTQLPKTENRVSPMSFLIGFESQHNLTNYQGNLNSPATNDSITGSSMSPSPSPHNEGACATSNEPKAKLNPSQNEPIIPQSLKNSQNPPIQSQTSPTTEYLNSTRSSKDTQRSRNSMDSARNSIPVNPVRNKTEFEINLSPPLTKEAQFMKMKALTMKFEAEAMEIETQAMKMGAHCKKIEPQFHSKPVEPKYVENERRSHIIEHQFNRNEPQPESIEPQRLKQATDLRNISYNSTPILSPDFDRDSTEYFQRRQEISEFDGSFNSPESHSPLAGVANDVRPSSQKATRSKSPFRFNPETVPFQNKYFENHRKKMLEATKGIVSCSVSAAKAPVIRYAEPEIGFPVKVHSQEIRSKAPDIRYAEPRVHSQEINGRMSEVTELRKLEAQFPRSFEPIVAIPQIRVEPNPKIRVPVRVSNFKSPSDMYLVLQTKECLEVALRIKQKLHCINREDSSLPIKVGNFYAIVTPNYRFRAQLVSFDLNGQGSATIYNVDTGETSEVPTACLKRLTLDLAQFPAQALHCYMKDISELKLIPTLLKWCHEIFDKNEIPAIIFSKPFDGSYEVLLYLPDLPYYTFSEYLKMAVLEDSCHKLANPENGYKSDYESVDGTPTESQVAVASYRDREGIPLQTVLIESTHSSDRGSPDDRLSWDAQIATMPSLTVTDESGTAIMSFAASPAEFYAHVITDCISLFDKQQIEMNTFYENFVLLELVYTKVNVQVGSYWCCQRVGDPNWYRIKILAFKDEHSEVKNVAARPKRRHGSKIIVQTVDYGDTFEMELRDIYPLTVGFANMPAFAVRFMMSSVEPLTPAWTDENTLQFAALVTYEQEFIFEVVEIRSENEYEVKLFRQENDIVVDLALALHESLALRCIYYDREACVTPDEVRTLNNYDPMGEAFNSMTNNYQRPDDDAIMAVTGRTFENEKYQCKFFRMGDCWKGDLCPYEHIRNDSGILMDGKDILVGQPIALPAPDREVYAMVTSAYDPGHFYVVFPYGPKSTNLIHETHLNEKTELEFVTEAMTKYYERRSTQMEDLSGNFSCGELVVVKSDRDGFWYRAVIFDAENQSDLIRVNYVDFGDTELVPKRNIRFIQPQFCHMPYQAVECFMANIAPPQTSHWSDESKQMFKEKVEGKIIRLSVVHSSMSAMYVEIVIKEDNQLINVSAMLTSLGQAVKLPPDLRHPKPRTRSSVELKCPG